MFGRFYAEPDKYAPEILVYESIRTEHTLIALFEPDPPARNLIAQLDDIWYYLNRSLDQTANLRYIGPTIEIYRVD